MRNQTMQKRTRPTANVIKKTFRVIELMATKDEWSLSELSRSSKYPKTTMHRILRTLEEMGYVRQNRRNQLYSATIRFFEVGSKVIQTLDFVGIAYPLMLELSNITGETINLGVLDGLDVVCLRKVESKHYLRLDQPIGHREKAYFTAFGKAILAYLPYDQRSKLFLGDVATPATSKSLRTVGEIEKDLKMVKVRGYSMDNGEGVDGVSCVGAPIFGRDSTVIAGLSIAGPTLRVDKNLEYFGKLVRETADCISGNFGLNSLGVSTTAVSTDATQKGSTKQAN